MSSDLEARPVSNVESVGAVAVRHAAVSTIVAIDHITIARRVVMFFVCAMRASGLRAGSARSCVFLDEGSGVPSQAPLRRFRARLGDEEPGAPVVFGAVQARSARAAADSGRDFTGPLVILLGSQ